MPFSASSRISAGAFSGIVSTGTSNMAPKSPSGAFPETMSMNLPRSSTPTASPISPGRAPVTRLAIADRGDLPSNITISSSAIVESLVEPAFSSALPLSVGVKMARLSVSSRLIASPRLARQLGYGGGEPECSQLSASSRSGRTTLLYPAQIRVESWPVCGQPQLATKGEAHAQSKQARRRVRPDRRSRRDQRCAVSGGGRSGSGTNSLRVAGRPEIPRVAEPGRRDPRRADVRREVGQDARQPGDHRPRRAYRGDRRGRADSRRRDRDRPRPGDGASRNDRRARPPESPPAPPPRQP